MRNSHNHRVIGKPEGNKGRRARRELAACKTLATRKRKRSRMSTVQFANGPTRSMGHVLGAEKDFFLIRGRGRPTATAAPVECCQSVVLRSPWGRLGSVLDVRNRLHRMRGGFHRCIHISKVLCALLLWTMSCQSFRSRALWGAPSPGACGVGDHPTPDLSLSESGSRSACEKSV